MKYSPPDATYKKNKTSTGLPLETQEYQDIFLKTGSSKSWCVLQINFFIQIELNQSELTKVSWEIKFLGKNGFFALSTHSITVK